VSIQFKTVRLNPGETLNLYVEVKGKHTIPGVASMEGYCNQATWVFEDAGLAPRSFDTGFRPKFFKVIGPVPKPVGILPMIEKLIEITTGSRNQKWITKQGIYNGLLAKLNAAKNNIIKGSSSYHTASNICYCIIAIFSSKCCNRILTKTGFKPAFVKSCYPEESSQNSVFSVSSVAKFFVVLGRPLFAVLAVRTRLFHPVYPANSCYPVK